MSKLLAVDGSSVFMRALNVLPEEKRTVDDLEYMTVGMLRKAVRVTGATHLVVALDTTEQCWRYHVHPQYKCSRNYSDLRPKQLTPMLLPRLQERRIATAYDPVQEADDVLYTLATQLKDPHELVCYTRDSDMYHAVHLNRVSLLWPQNGGELEHMDRLAVELKLGYPPAWMPAVRALTADGKDDLRAILGVEKGWRCPITQPRAIDLLAQYDGSFHDVLFSAQAGDARGMKDKEIEFLCLHGNELGAIWYVCQLSNKAQPNVNAASTRVSDMDFRSPME